MEENVFLFRLKLRPRGPDCATIGYALMNIEGRLRVSPEDSGKEDSYANTITRPALRRANVAQEAWLYVNRGHHAQPGDWRERGDLYRGQWSAVAPAALRRAG